ncbi:hypothetical protein EV421DRAFT_2000456 [Armillaria borealis]|uniref:Uncharacterized protein n=1 Tax=Armillaria borealis TaxID=47425 RepID=A0AA39MGI5_9AGAR|nr:hypothetical protein EV421DRAFT_2000456 [Armillaria borealis]
MMPAPSKQQTCCRFPRCCGSIIDMVLLYSYLLRQKRTGRRSNGICDKGDIKENDDTSLIRMAVEDTVHYRHSDPTAQMEWKYSYPRGLGSFRAGPDYLAYFITTFHELHCVESLGKMLLALCHPDMTLEPGDFMERNFTEERTGEEHICNDWEEVSDAGTRNWIEWYEWRKYAGSVDSKKGNGL